MNVVFQGVVKRITDAVRVSDNYEKLSIHLECKEGEYTNVYEIEVANKVIPQAQKITEGEEVVITANLKGREWTNKQGEVKAFNSISAWKIESTGAKPKAKKALPNVEDDDIPF